MRNNRDMVSRMGPQFMATGRWAGDRLAQAVKEGKEISPDLLRDSATMLRRDEWKLFDDQLIQNTQIRLRGIADLKAAGLTKQIPNAMGKTILEWERVGDMLPANVSLDGVTRAENDRIEFSFEGIPLPIIHKDWYLNLRALSASRSGGTPLDTAYVAAAGLRIGEASEDMLFNGGRQFGGLPIYGYTTHPDRNTVSFGTGGDWTQAAKTGDQILSDVQTMLQLAQDDGFYGPYILYIGGGAAIKLGSDFKAASDKSIRQRILELEQISDIRTVDTLDPTEVLMIQMTPDVVQLLEGEPLQNVQWDVEGGFQINFKAFMIEVPLIKSTGEGDSGIVHMA